MDVFGVDLADWARIASIAGIPVAIAVFVFNKSRERFDRRYGSYNNLDEKYLDYLKLCLQNPSLDVFDVPLSSHRSRPQDKRKELQMFSMLIAIFERAYLMHRNVIERLVTQRSQWKGWKSYMEDWTSRRNFRLAWKRLSGQFDKRFESFINDQLLAKARLATKSGKPLRSPRSTARLFAAGRRDNKSLKLSP